ncbi:MAG: glycosyltransferase [Crocinitomicaceae bacterium]|nr:glycosyltransferase [Crocinitomicaceae bacterium]|tara:strand:- start:3487 stop:4449 length:963 start_codon:yes stop_codon:yes gene_type:complete
MSSNINNNSPELSVVVCVYNEEQNIEPLIQQIYQALEGRDFELLYVDDGSTDNTVAEIKRCMRSGMKLVELRKNYGQSNALAAGIHHASGKYIALLDGDLQNDPLDIPIMLDKLHKEGVDVVAGIRANRQDGMLLRKIPSKFANWIIRTTTDVHIKDYGCTLKVFDSDIAKNMGLYGELHRFIPILAKLEGAKITQMDVRHHARQFGTSKYGLNRTLKVMSDLMLMLFFQKYLSKPMHLFGGLGILTFAIGVLINVYLLVLKILGHDIWGKPLLVLGLLLVLGGIQLVTTGIVVELLMRIYYEGQHKKPYRVKQIHTLES